MAHLYKLGLMSVLYKSNDKILLTAIMDDETVLVKAMKRRTKNATTHLSPIRALIVYGITRPAFTSTMVNWPG